MSMPTNLSQAWSNSNCNSNDYILEVIVIVIVIVFSKWDVIVIVIEPIVIGIIYYISITSDWLISFVVKK